MPDYRCYPMSLSGSITEPGRVIDCIDDASAITKALEIFPERDFEVWQAARKVYRTQNPQANSG